MRSRNQIVTIILADTICGDEIKTLGIFKNGGYQK